jgi:hypothetical protein
VTVALKFICTKYVHKPYYWSSKVRDSIPDASKANTTGINLLLQQFERVIVVLNGRHFKTLKCTYVILEPLSILIFITYFGEYLK